MRIVLFILMLILLPLRGWMGDAMATSMAITDLRASSSPVSINVVGANKASKSQVKEVVQVQSSAGHAAFASPDCEGHTLSGQANSDETDHCTPCSACGACHAASISTTAPTWSAMVHVATLLTWPVDAYFSADEISRQKPPIS